jgi:phenylacetate-CoA ligase
LSKEALQQLQFKQLKKALINAYEKSPFYGKIFRQASINPYDLIDFNDINNFPLITKEQYRENIENVLSKDAKQPFLVRAFTGGTTGLPVPVYRNISDFAREKAFTAYAYQMLGMDLFTKTVYIRGQVDDSRGIFHKISNNGKTLYLSSHNMTDESLENYIKLIFEFRPQLLYTLPSVAMILAGYMKNNNVAPFEDLKWVFCPSENLYPFQKDFIEGVLKCQAGTFYGHSEHAVMATRCTHSDMYHVLPQYGYAELIDENGIPVKEEGRLGEIVGTSFTNPCCPVIRYRTGDYAVYTTKKCKCGRNYQTWDKIEGRGQDIALGKNNESISMGPDFLCTIFDNTYMKIKQFRIEQHHIGELTFMVLPHKGSDMHEIRRYFNRVFDEQYPGCFKIEVLHMEESKLRKRDKHRFFIQHIEKEKNFLN